MYCKWCGMDSKDDKRCEWCGRPFAAVGADPESTRAVADQTAAGGPPTTAVAPVTTAMGSAPDPASAPTTTVPQADFDPTDPLPYSPRLTGAKPIKVEVVELAPFEVRFEKYFGVITLMVAVGMAAAHYLPAFWMAPFLAALFVSGLTMGVFRVIEYFDEDFFDVAVLLVAVAFIGPIIAGLAYLALAFVRRESNWSLLGLMASYAVIRLAIGGAAHGFVDTVTYMAGFHISLGLISIILQLIPPLALISGWMVSSFTRPLNE